MLPIKSGLDSNFFFNITKKYHKYYSYRNYTIRNNVTDESHTDCSGTWRQNVVGAQEFQNLKVGPYKRGRWVVSFKEDPGSFVTNMLIFVITGYTIFTLSPGNHNSLDRRIHDNQTKEED